MTYQAPFNAGLYLSIVTQKFKNVDVFGPGACSNVYNFAHVNGLTANLIGSDGLDAFAQPAVITATAASTFVTAGGTNGIYYQTAEDFSRASFNYSPTVAVITAGNAEIIVASNLLVLAKAAQATASDPDSRTLANALVENVQLLIDYTNILMANSKALQPNIFETVGR